MNTPTALVIGDIALDRRTEGDAVDVSREAPVPTIHQTSHVESLGWAGNVAANIKALGHNVLLMATIGACKTTNAPEDYDYAGYRLIELAQALGIQTYFPHVVEKPTVVKHRVTCDNQIISRVDTQQHGMAADTALITGLDTLTEHSEQIKVIVISDNDNGTMTPTLVQAVREFANKFNIPIFVDCRADQIHLYRGVSLLKPNLSDAIRMLDLSHNVHPGLAKGVDTVNRLGVACQQLKADYEPQLVVVTGGRYGCAYTDDIGISYYDAFGDTEADGARDICGAGDTVIAALAVGLIEGLEWSNCVHFAMQCAGYVVRYFGSKLADRDQVEEFIWQRTNWTKKLMDDTKLTEFLDRHRRMNPSVRIVLANGCFDGFHAGHLETLRYAKRSGDVLVVAYNDDTSLRELKGEARPHVPDSFRASHIALQESVDAVVRFDGDVERLVRRIRPEVLVKGDDAKQKYTNLPGADFVASIGGHVRYCDTDQFYITIDRENLESPDKENPDNQVVSG